MSSLPSTIRTSELRRTLTGDVAADFAGKFRAVADTKAIVLLAMSPIGQTGKSLLTQLLASATNTDAQCIFDCNPISPTTKRIGLSAHDVIDMNVDRPIRTLLSLLEPIRRGATIVLADFGPCSEAVLLPSVIQFVAEARALNVKVCIVRPMGADYGSQSTVVATSAKLLDAGAAVLAVANLGQGRKPEHFRAWKNSGLRESLMRRAFADCHLEGYDRQVMDNATMLGVSLEAIALDRLSHKLNDDVRNQLFPWALRGDLAIYLVEQQRTLMRALADIISRWP
jgi:Mrp family chromosome partitioning ATPase